MKSANISISLGILAITMALIGIFTSLHNLKDIKGIEKNFTEAVVEAVVTTTSAEVKPEYKVFCDKKNDLNAQATKLLEYVKTMETMSPELLTDLESLQSEFENIRKEAKNLPEKDYNKIADIVNDDTEWYQPILYVEDGYELKNLGSDDWNFKYEEGIFRIKGHYWRTVAWSQNIMVDKDNEDVYQERLYAVIDPLKPAYMLISSEETPLQLVVIK